MKIVFLYPKQPISPHKVHLTWAKSVGAKKIIATPKGFGFFDLGKIGKADVLLLESLYCLPFAKKYKEKINPNCKIISIIADTSFWKKKLSIARRIYYKLYLDAVDGFITVSERIKKDIIDYIDKPVEVVRPFPVYTYNFRERKYGKNILFIGNEVIEKGFLYLVKAMKYLQDFDLYLVGSCCKRVKTKPPNVHLEGKVPSLRKYFEICSYYVHPADFDPCPVTVFEAMWAGLLTVISKEVGQKEIFEERSLKEFILDKNSPEEIANKLRFFERKEELEKREYSDKLKKIAREFKKENSIKEFKKKFWRILTI